MRQLCSPTFVPKGEAGTLGCIRDRIPPQLLPLSSTCPTRNSSLPPARVRSRTGRNLIAKLTGCSRTRSASFCQTFPIRLASAEQTGRHTSSGGEYQFYKNAKIEPMLAKQVTTYFEEILKTNGHIEQFIHDSDYTYMNHTLAKWIYKREDIEELLGAK